MFPGKRLIICLDGTGNSAIEDAAPSLTNIYKIMAAVTKDADGVQQVVHYDEGVGTSHQASKIKGMLTGKGLMHNIKQAYLFLVNNYQQKKDAHDGDEIYITGFSRGAFTARLLAAFMAKVGILKKEHASEISEVFDAFLQNDEAALKHYKNEKYFLDIGENKKFIDFLGVFDTVPAMGKQGEDDDPEYGVDKIKQLPSVVKKARHALSAHERRDNFLLDKWESTDGQDSQQVFFTGDHSDVGGGNKHTEKEKRLSNIPLRWMLRESGLDYNLDAVGVPDLTKKQELTVDNAEYMGKIHDQSEMEDNTLAPAYKLLGTFSRHVCDKDSPVEHDRTRKSAWFGEHSAFRFPFFWAEGGLHAHSPYTGSIQVPCDAAERRDLFLHPTLIKRINEHFGDCPRGLDMTILERKEVFSEDNRDRLRSLLKP
ncbi:MAG: hypothetical protein DHS20C10_06650 [marine bacterium B5-7]|nr:MAG: hypothetical protein DHS20C10_06650 [marine bacterium B5-7]